MIFTIDEVYRLMLMFDYEEDNIHRERYEYMIENGVNRVDYENFTSWYEDENGRIYKYNKERI